MPDTNIDASGWVRETISSIEQRVSRLETHRERDYQVMAEIKGDVRLILDKIEDINIGAAQQTGGRTGRSSIFQWMVSIISVIAVVGSLIHEYIWGK